MGCPVSRWPGKFRGADRILGRRKFKSSYTIGPKVGTGAFAQVRLCYHIATGHECVVKIISKPYSAEDFALEISLLRQVGDGSCSNVVRFFDDFEDNRYYYSVMEYCRGGDLFSVVANKPDTTEAALSCWMRQILEGISHIHLLGIVHRDVKPQNLLFGDEECTTIKIIDFGLSFQMQKGELLDEPCGTPEFLSPEMVLGRYGRKVDIWSVGVLCYILLFGCRPFVSTTDAELFREIVETEPSYVPRDPNGVYNPSPDAVNFCKMLLQKNSRKRPTAVEALKHVWLTGPKEIIAGLSIESNAEIPSNIRQLARAETAAIGERDRQRQEDAIKMSSMDSREAVFRLVKRVDSSQLGTPGTTLKEGDVPLLAPLRKAQNLLKESRKSSLTDRRDDRKRTRVNVSQYTGVLEEIDRLRAADVFIIPSNVKNPSVGIILGTEDNASVKNIVSDGVYQSSQPSRQVYAEKDPHTRDETSSSDSNVSSSFFFPEEKKKPNVEVFQPQWTLTNKKEADVPFAHPDPAAQIPTLHYPMSNTEALSSSPPPAFPTSYLAAHRSQSLSSSVIDPVTPTNDAVSFQAMTFRHDAEDQQSSRRSSLLPLSLTSHSPHSGSPKPLESSESTLADPPPVTTSSFPDGGVIRFETNGLSRPQAGLIVFEH